ncbi:hypothetical protein HYT26_00945 [Candidatus Pacearchaeota archaeon]|nr:hypothetical protein [Candidatus Pacearchaeota archaeon]
MEINKKGKKEMICMIRMFSSNGVQQGIASRRKNRIIERVKQMKKVDLFGNGVMSAVCDSCFEGKHLDPCGYDHREGFKDKDGLGDCKNTDGTSEQCCCGVGGHVFKGGKSLLIRLDWGIERGKTRV